MIPEDIKQPTNLPPLSDGEPVPTHLAHLHWINYDNSARWHDNTKDYPPPPNTLMYNDVSFAPLGDIQVLCGLPGNGKTQACVQLIACLLTGKWGRLTCIRTEPQRVLYCDTEQSQFTTAMINARVCALTGRDAKTAYEDFRILELRQISEPKERWISILKGIHEMQPTIVFIDGLLDLLEDFNDQKESKRLIDEIMLTATYYNVSIWLVIHLNTSVETKLMGHAGGFARRKATDVLKVVKVKKPGTNEVLFEVSQDIKTRGGDIEDWRFKIVSHNGVFIPEMITEPLTGDIDQIDTMIKWLSERLFDIPQPCTKGDVKEVLKAHGVTNNDRLTRDCEALINRRVLTEQPREEWVSGQRAPKYYLHLD